MIVLESATKGTEGGKRMRSLSGNTCKSSHTTMAKKGILVILVCTVLVLLSWFLNMHKFAIPKDQTRIKVDTPISSAPVKSALSARPYLPSNETIRKMSDVELEELYYTYVENMDVLCTKKIRLGNSGDGGWDVCDDEEYRPRPPCVVYSFGVATLWHERLYLKQSENEARVINFVLRINNDFTFDDAVLSTYGCEVHSFDPSMKGEVKRPDRMFFYKIGIGEKDFVNTGGWTIKTLTSIKAQLNHTKVNILKMDIESDEYKALPNIMESGELDGVDQLLFEIHLKLERQLRIDRMLQGLELFRGLRNLGFRVFYTHRNDACIRLSPITQRKRTVCNEVFMVNVNRNNQ